MHMAGLTQQMTHQTYTLPPSQLLGADLPVLPPLQLLWQPATSALALPQVSIQYGLLSTGFAVLYGQHTDERSFQALLGRGQQLSRSSQLPILLVLPYLSEEKLQVLQSQQISGIDLCGNGFIAVADRFLLRYSGQPNRFRPLVKYINAFEGVAGLVLRTLLRQPIHAKLDDLHGAILKRGGSISPSLVSRAIKALTAKLIAGRKNQHKAVLWQPERALGGLAEAWPGVGTRLLWRGRVQGSPAVFLPQLFANAQQAGVQAIVTGLGSVAQYSSFNLENIAYLYTERADLLLQDLVAQQTERFPNLELHSCQDPGVYFDGQRDQQAVVWASMLQSCLEALAGDARLYQVGLTLKHRLLAEAQAMLTEVM
jgi:hypothetical protein